MCISKGFEIHSFLPHLHFIMETIARILLYIGVF